jgi:hypothetical protein
VVVVVREYQHQQTRAATAREGCREMNAARKKSRPGGRGRDGVLEAVTGPGVVVDGHWRCGVVVRLSGAATRFWRLARSLAIASLDLTLLQNRLGWRLRAGACALVSRSRDELMKRRLGALCASALCETGEIDDEALDCCVQYELCVFAISSAPALVDTHLRHQLIFLPAACSTAGLLLPNLRVE